MTDGWCGNLVLSVRLIAAGILTQLLSPSGALVFGRGVLLELGSLALR
jgi:hypothetical protein